VIAEVEIFKLFLLVMARVSGLVVSAPIIGSGNYPIVAKVGLTGMIALTITPTLPTLDTPIPEAGIPFSLLATGEFMIGLLMGFVMSLVFAAVQIGGQILDLQTGFGMMNVFNPALETQFPIFGFFLFILAVLYLVLINGHHSILEGLIYSYEHVPMGGLAVQPGLFSEATRWGREMFVDGLMIAAPIGAAMLLAYITMGILGRVVPQIHLFVVGFPFTIGLGLFLMSLTISIYLQIVDGMFERMFRNVELAIHGIG
jgi:flagellar biosynthetic protein FliR